MVDHNVGILAISVPIKLGFEKGPQEHLFGTGKVVCIYAVGTGFG